MALIGLRKTNYGIDCNYHNISEYKEFSGRIEFTLNSYPTKELRLSGANPLIQTRMAIEKWKDLSVLNEEGMNHIRYCYEKILGILNSSLDGEQNQVSMARMLSINFEGEVTSDVNHLEDLPDIETEDETVEEE